MNFDNEREDTENSQSKVIDTLPSDCWINILLFCEPSSILSVMCVSKHHHGLTDSVGHYQRSFWDRSSGYTPAIMSCGSASIQEYNDESSLLHYWKQKYQSTLEPDLLFFPRTDALARFSVCHPLNGTTIPLIEYPFIEKLLFFQSMRMYDREDMYCAIAEKSICLYSGSELLSTYRCEQSLSAPVVWCRNLRNFIFLVTRNSFHIFNYSSQTSQLHLLRDQNFELDTLGVVRYRISENYTRVEFYVVSNRLSLTKVTFNTIDMSTTSEQIVAGGYQMLKNGQLIEYDEISELSYQDLWVVVARSTYPREIVYVNLLKKLVVRTHIECIALGAHPTDPLVYFTARGIDQRMYTLPKPPKDGRVTLISKTPLNINRSRRDRAHGAIKSICHRGNFIACTSWSDCVYVVSPTTHAIIGARDKGY